MTRAVGAVITGTVAGEHRTAENTAENHRAQLDTSVSSRVAAMTPIDLGKGRHKVLRFAIGEYAGRVLLSARIWGRPDERDEFRPSKAGWAFGLERLPGVIAALQTLEAEARRAGLL